MRHISSCIVGTFLMAILFFPKTAHAHDDWGLISDTFFKIKLNEKNTLIIFPEIKTRDDMGELYWQQYRLGLSHKVNDWLTLASYYHYSELKSSSTGKWSGENRVLFDVIFNGKLAGLKLSDRNRTEVRFLGDRERVRYRNEIKIQKPMKLFSTALTPFVSNEIYYEFQTERATINWLSIGCFKRINKNLGISLFYRLESTRSGRDWSERNCIGITTVVNF